MRKFLFVLLSCFLMAANAIAHPIPDTGQTTCYDDVGNVITCPSPGQPFYGQDANYNINPMSFTKLGYNGVELPEDAPHVDDGGPWIMTRDNLTRLIWEVKIITPGLKNSRNRYSWYDPDPATNGGNAGIQDGGSCYDSLCDTHAYIQALNAQKFGGFSDWRLPTIKELAYLVDYSIPLPGPTLNVRYFPNMEGSYWSSNTDAKHAFSAWYLSFRSGMDHKMTKDWWARVIAVRGKQADNNFIDNSDGTITDISTGLMWQKSPVQNWEAAMNWEQALAYCEALTLGGYSDWRLPTIKELRSIVDYSLHDPAINNIYFPNTDSGYLSSTTYADYKSSFWGMGFRWGEDYVNGKSSTTYILPVRVLFGNLQVLIEPQQVLYAGAQWRRTGTKTWHNSGYTETKVPVGTYTIEFKVVPGWRPEGTISVIVEAGKTVTGKVSYFEQVTGLPGVMMLLLDE